MTKKNPQTAQSEATQPKVSLAELHRLRDAWAGRWEEALALWSRYVQLSSPRFCCTQKDEAREGLQSSFAMIRLNDHGVVISLRQVVEHGLQDFPLEVMAHEIGHHVYCPGDLTDHGRMLARIRRGLPGMENKAGMIANLYSDLFINDRLQRAHDLRMDAVYRALNVKTNDGLWNFYMRIYEILWGLPARTLTSPGFEIPAAMEGDAQLGNRLIRTYASDHIRGSGRFAALCLPYLLEENQAHESMQALTPFLDADAPGAGASGAFPDGLTRMDDDELTGSIHPALEKKPIKPRDRSANTDSSDVSGPAQNQTSAGTEIGHAGQYREPFEYGQILQAMGIKLDAQDMAARYYRERAMPHLVRYPVREMPAATEPLPEGLDTWEVGTPISRIDWVQTAIRSPLVIPGYTTVERVYGTTAGSDPQIEPVDLDLYVDCSGSMPNPGYATSFLTLAGAIIALSALRVGAKVQATLWSGANQFLSTDGFVTKEREIMRILTGYLGGGTAFPIHKLRDTYAARDRKTHILVISDDGVTTMFDADEHGTSGWDIARNALAVAEGGGTFVLQLWRDIEQNKELVAAREMGWDIHSIREWDDLVAFARAFSRKHYEKLKDKTRSDRQRAATTSESV